MPNGGNKVEGECEHGTRRFAAILAAKGGPRFRRRYAGSLIVRHAVHVSPQVLFYSMMKHAAEEAIPLYWSSPYCL